MNSSNKKKSTSLLFPFGKNSILAKKYKILKKIGQSQVSVVYLAKNLNLKQLVAIKCPIFLSSRKEKVQELILDGARLLAKLNHPNIARVFDVDLSNDTLYVVMEYVKGKSLEKLVAKDHPFSLETALHIAILLANGLNYSHQKKILHGDINPKNVILKKENQPVLVGFDLASSLENSKSIDRKKIGKHYLEFVAPEILKKGKGDQRSDIWSLGILFFHLFLGKAPLKSFESKRIFAKNSNPFHSSEKDLPPSLQKILFRMTKLPLEERFSSMEEVSKQLVEVQKELFSGSLVVDIWTSDLQMNQFFTSDRGNTYEIIKKRGVGTFGIVYKALDKKLNRIVALKILKSEYLDNQEIISRFQREAQAVSLIRHPNVVEIYTVGELKGVPFFVMSYIEGEDLDSLLCREIYFPIVTALKISLGIAKGLKAAHKAGVIHRDLKPANILMKSKFPIITDFGVAYIANRKRLTEETSIMGTLLYMAPEQTNSAHVDNRSDLYSLGVILYEMLSGLPPFVGDNPMELLKKIALEPPTSFQELDVQIPKEVEDFVHILLQKRAEDRFKNAKATIFHLKKLLHQLSKN